MGDWSVNEIYLARAVLELADLGGMPDSYWQTDQRIQFAREVVGLDVDQRGQHDSTEDEI